VVDEERHPVCVLEQLLQVRMLSGQEPEIARPYVAAQLWHQLKDMVGKELPQALLPGTQDTVVLVAELRKRYPPSEVRSEDAPGVQVWEKIGLYYFYLDMLHDALGVFFGLYEQMLRAQSEGPRVHKGLPLARLHDTFHRMGYRSHSQRYAMLTLCEDAATRQQDPTWNVRGSKWRLVRREGLADETYERYLETTGKVLPKAHPRWTKFPEFVLQNLDQSWLRGPASPDEAQVYWANGHYVGALLGQSPGPYGKRLEWLADYLMSCMAGCRTARRRLTYSSDLDLVCSLETLDADYRSDFGRYFICECKGRQTDAGKSVAFTDFAKFCRVLDSVKCRFGVLFAPEKISGEKAPGSQRQYSEREQRLKVFMDRGIVVVVIKREDVEAVRDGRNLVTMLREKYETVRLDLRDSQRGPGSTGIPAFAAIRKTRGPDGGCA